MRIQQAIRATLAFGLGIFITFSQSHSAQVGLITLGIFGITSGLSGALVVILRRNLSMLQELPMATLATLIGIFALLALGTESAQHSAFIALVAAWGLISGAFALYQSRRAGRKEQSGTDFLISAVFGLLLGVLFLAVDLDIVSAVGFFGAYLALEGVHLGIAASTPKAK